MNIYIQDILWTHVFSFYYKYLEMKPLMKKSVYFNTNNKNHELYSTELYHYTLLPSMLTQ